MPVILSLIDKTLSRSKRTLRSNIKNSVKAFFAQYSTTRYDIILDSTGLRSTSHYSMLMELGRERLEAATTIHAVSGGILAYFGFCAAQDMLLQRPINDYFNSFDLEFRRIHHQNFHSRLRATWRFLNKETPFSTQQLLDTLKLIFSDELLNTALSSLPKNFVPYVAQSKKGEMLPARDALGPAATVLDLLLAAIRVPQLYGYPDAGGFFDAAFCQGYKAFHRKLAGDSERPSLVSTPWKSGKRGKVHYVRCYHTSKPQYELLSDLLLFVGDLPNRHYELDLAFAFGGENK